ncbi:MAG TPA: hypothetical protein PKO06_03030, partial [Candidatus Ozemobacteraceae bacterium]|nr:hypothetical protein [Candidatus Ozemobacteraceae bacterium]
SDPDSEPPALPEELASLSLWLSHLRTLQSNAEEIWHVGKAGYAQHPRVKILQVTSLKTLDDIKGYESMNWDKASDWISRARVLGEQFRTLYWSLSRWVLEKSSTWVDRLPPLTLRTRHNLETLEGDYLILEATIASETGRSRNPK